jgi:hypothetical protein
VKTLLELKAEYKKVTGQDWKPDAAPPATPAAPVAASVAPAPKVSFKKSLHGKTFSK